MTRTEDIDFIPGRSENMAFSMIDLACFSSMRPPDTSSNDRGSVEGEWGVGAEELAAALSRVLISASVNIIDS